MKRQSARALRQEAIKIPHKFNLTGSNLNELSCVT